ncbi:MAG: diguanylate cyclase domain-containing protein [Planctomycetia bacterium]|jgi:diguanylate cyclase (GGDEF)-like protein
MRRGSERDHVTGLDTRGTLAAFLSMNRRPLAAAICDVVGLKSVNDRDGFLAGDDCLRQAADRLRSAAGDAAILARLGGDELLAVYVGVTAAAAADRTAALLRGPGTPPLRAAAGGLGVDESPDALVERLYATLRQS